MLIQAAREGDIGAVRKLIDDGEDVNSVDDRGATALHYAVEIGNRALVSLLLEHGANINARDEQFGATPAGWAIEYLRNAGAYLGIELDDLAFAIENRDVRWIERILRRFPKLRDTEFRDGTTFRELAARCGDPKIAALFN